MPARTSRSAIPLRDEAGRRAAVGVNRREERVLMDAESVPREIEEADAARLQARVEVVDRPFHLRRIQVRVRDHLEAERAQAAADRVRVRDRRHERIALVARIADDERDAPRCGVAVERGRDGAVRCGLSGPRFDRAGNECRARANDE